MRCVLAIAEPTDDGRNVFVCSRCGKSVKARTDNPAAVKMQCNVAHAAPCRHIGKEVRREKCQTCKGNIQVKVMACAVFRECTLAKPLPGINCCASCPRWESTASPQSRPLIPGPSCGAQ